MLTRIIITCDRIADPIGPQISLGWKIPRCSSPRSASVKKPVKWVNKFPEISLRLNNS